MRKDQRKAPIIDALKTYHKSKITPFTTPGHKMGAGVLKPDLDFMGPLAFRNDICMQNGADDRRETKGIVEEAESLFADAVGADTSFYSTNGSSLSGHVAILSVANVGEKVLVARNTHKSLVGAIVMADVVPVWLQPEIDNELDIEHGVSPEMLEQMLDRHPDAKGVFIVSPTYFGVVSDIKALAKICHRHKIPLIVDEAWAPHFPFCSQLPAHALSQGADMSYGSIHKTMNGLGQSSVIHIKGKRIDPDRFTLCFDLFESTSPSSLMLASCDAARRQMALHGEKLWTRTLELARRAREELTQLPGIRVIGREVLNRPGTFDLDETKLVIDLDGLGVNGYIAADWIVDKHKLTFELITHRHLMALISVADTEDSVGKLIKAVKSFHRWAMKTKRDKLVPMPHHRDLGSEQVMAPTKAFFGKTRKVPLKKAAGEIIAEIVSPYPPGIPRLIPGERITQAHVDYLETGRKAGMFVLDPSDQTLKTLRVVDLDPD